MTDVKHLIVDAFNVMLKEYTAQNNKWKCKAYNTALNSLKDVSEVKSLDDVKDLKGFGKSLTAHVKEIIDTHQMQNAQTSEYSTHVQNLMKVHGIGVQAARKFVGQGIHSIKDLRLAFADGKVKLTDAQIYGLKYFDDIQLRIPFSEMEKHEAFMIEKIRKLSNTASLHVVGSFRRKTKDSGDIDVLITDQPDNPKLLDDFIKEMTVCFYFFGKLAQGSVKYNGFCKLLGNGKNTVRRVDVLYTKPEEYAFALLYFTGSDEFNKEMRAHALKKGYSLNQRNMIDMKTKKVVNIHFNNEKDIFYYLGLEYVEPQDRYSGKVIPFN